MDISSLDKNLTVIEQAWQLRVNLYENGLSNLGEIPNDFYLYTMPNDMYDDYENLYRDYMEKYFDKLNAINSYLTPLKEVQDHIFSKGATGIAEIRKVAEFHKFVIDLCGNIKNSLDEHSPAAPTEDRQDFSDSYLDVDLQNMNYGDLHELRKNILFALCQEIEDIAALDIKALDIEIGFMHHMGYLDSGGAHFEKGLECVGAMIGRSSYFLDKANDYLEDLSRGHHMPEHNPEDMQHMTFN